MYKHVRFRDEEELQYCINSYPILFNTLDKKYLAFSNITHHGDVSRGYECICQEI